MQNILNNLSETEKSKAIEENKLLRKNMLKYPAYDPMDETYRRIAYVRYADDWLIGIIGSKSDAEKVKCDLSNFLASELKLTVSPKKTLITNGHNMANFLGYNITVSKENGKVGIDVV
ncbi:hypothetical protein A7W90_00435 [Clostridium sp. Bc-iso-3]|nr:hypothetical protein A7W90_00435 [Clostridium sp. Bc-iso-3]